MKKVALVVLAALLFTFYAPKAQAQPFADVPTDIFAFDAVAELAAKGIIEGYPDGTFKGDRAMTRYEMAMVVARMLARIEAIKIPPPPAAPPKGVTPANLAAIQRVVNEFRAELAAQGVRVTAVEEELAAIRQRLSNVKITGDVRFRYNQFQAPTVAGGVAVPGLSIPGTLVPSIFYRNRLTFVGQATSNVRATARITTGSLAGANGSSQFNFGGAVGGPPFAPVTFDIATLDYSGLLGANWTLGRQGYTQNALPLFGGLGLLFDPSNMSNIGVADGLLARGTFGGFSWQAGVWRYDFLVGATQSSTDIWNGTVGFTVIPGWTLNVGAISQRRNHVALVAPMTQDTGWEANIQGNLLPGVGFGAAFANFNGNTAPGSTGNGGGAVFAASASSNAWIAWAKIDLGALSGMTQFAPMLAVWYKNYGPDPTPTALTGPIYSGAATQFFNNFVWNFQGWGANLNFKFTPDLSGTVVYESGSCKNISAAQACSANGASVQELFAQASYALATRTSLAVNYRSQTVGGSSAAQYRVQLTYSY